MNKPIRFFIAIVIILIIIVAIVWRDKNLSKKYSANQILLNKVQKEVNIGRQYLVDLIAKMENDLSNITKEDYINAQKPTSIEEKIGFCIVTASYNNSKYVNQSINSLFRQDYHNWRLIYIDDASTDGMSELISTIKQNSGLDDNKFNLITYKDHKGSAAYSFNYAANNFCKDQEVMVVLDGDDILADNKVLSRLAGHYNNSNIWLTYGSFVEIPEGNIGVDYAREFSAKEWKNIRELPWSFSHLRTYYTWLFKKIKIEDLSYQGDFVKYAPDMATMYPMLEMAGKNRVKFIDEVMYIYRIHEKNENRIPNNQQKVIDNYIRGLSPYKEITIKK